MAIQSRRGAYADFDPNKMLPGEWAVVTSGDPNDPDGRAIYLCYIAGIVERMATYEDMKKNVQSAAKGERGSRWDYGTKITGTSTSEQIFSNSGINDANKGDYYLNISTGYVYYCTVGGLASVAKWKYILVPLKGQLDRKAPWETQVQQEQLVHKAPQLPSRSEQ